MNKVFFFPLSYIFFSTTSLVISFFMCIISIHTFVWRHEHINNYRIYKGWWVFSTFGSIVILCANVLYNIYSVYMEYILSNYSNFIYFYIYRPHTLFRIPDRVEYFLLSISISWSILWILHLCIEISIRSFDNGPLYTLIGLHFGNTCLHMYTFFIISPAQIEKIADKNLKLPNMLSFI